MLVQCVATHCSKLDLIWQEMRMKEGFSHLPSGLSWPMQHLLPRFRLFSPMSAGAQTLASYPLTTAEINK